MVTGALRTKVDAIWDAFWSGGIANPLEVMEQITYLLFVRRLDDLHTAKENRANRTGGAIEDPIFPPGDDGDGLPYEDLRWSRLKDAEPGEMFATVGERVFPFLRQLGGDGSTYSQHMRDARFTIPTPALLGRVVDMLDGLPMEGRDTKGDVYEYMLSKIASAGQNGQFRTPRHLPITGGELNPKTAAGVINHSGGLSLKAGKTTVSLTDFRIKVGKRVGLSARVGNARLKVLDLSLAKAKVSRNGFGLKVRGVRAYLSRGAAGALNKAFKTHLFRRGTRVGTASVSATFAEAILAKGSTTLALDAGAAAALSSLGVSAASVSPAKAGSAGLAFPITGGKVNLSTLVGKITHRGGIALSKGSTRVELTRFTINVDSAPDLTARVGSSRVSILDLDVSGLTRSVSGRTITLGGVKATLTQAAADALNGAFATTAFTKGLLLGTATVKATAR